MKRLIQFRDFIKESNRGSGNASFDWLVKQKNEAYFELTEILQGELFDDFDISPKDDEEFTDGDHPTNPFWSYTVEAHNNFTSKCEEVGDKEIDRIVVFNIKHKDYPEFKQRLVELKERAEDFIGREIRFNKISRLSWKGYRTIPDPELYYWDFIIKIGKMI